MRGWKRGREWEGKFVQEGEQNKKKYIRRDTEDLFYGTCQGAKGINESHFFLLDRLPDSIFRPQKFPFFIPSWTLWKCLHLIHKINKHTKLFEDNGNTAKLFIE